MGTTNSQSTNNVTWFEFIHAIHIPSLALVSLAVWLHAADALIVATMLPSIVGDLGGASLVGWLVALYEMGSIVAGATSALLVMRYGLRRPMKAAALIFGLGCFFSAISQSMPFMLIGRLLQGIGGGGLVAMGFVTVSTVFERRYIARALAIISAFWGLSAFMGPLIGGLFIEFANWRLGFGFFGLKAIGLAVWIGFHAPHSRQADQQKDPKIRLPAARLALLSASILSVAIAGIDVGPITSPVLIGIGLIAFVLFLRRDALAGDHSRLLPYAPLNPRTPAGATLSMILALSIATIPITAFGPLLISAIHNPSALTIGYIVACSSIGWTITAIAVSSAPERLDALLITLGILLVVLSIPGFIVTIPRGPLWLIAACATLEGGGFGIAWTFILRRTTALSPPDPSLTKFAHKMTKFEDFRDRMDFFMF